MGNVWISPADDLQAVLLELVRGAEASVFLASFTPLGPLVAAAMAERAEAGLNVRAVVDGGPAQGHDLVHHPFPYRAVEVHRGSMHHKFALVDGERLLAGSFNFGSSGPNGRNFLVRMDECAGRFAVEAEALWMLPDARLLLLPHQALKLIAAAQGLGALKLLRDIDANVLRRGHMTDAEERAVRGIIRKGGRPQPTLPGRREMKGIDPELGF